MITGEYGFEDFINPTTAAGTLDATLSIGEDVNENGQLDTYGVGALGAAFGVANNDPTIRINCNTIGRKNRVTGPRHGLKLVDAELGDVPTKPDNTGGFTVASENIVYVQGHYNANVSGFGAPMPLRRSSQMPSVFFPRTGWIRRAFRIPLMSIPRNADTTYYRVAVAAGKSLNWPNPALGQFRPGCRPGRRNSQFSALSGRLGRENLLLQRLARQSISFGVCRWNL